MTAIAKQALNKRRLLLASDRNDQSSELADILRIVGDVDTVSTSDIPRRPAPLRHRGRHQPALAGERAAGAQQAAGRRLSQMPRLFVLADALHHASMQAWALGATDTISRPFDPDAILQRIRAAFPDSIGFDETDRGKTLNRGVAAAHAVLVKMFEKLAGRRP